MHVARALCDALGLHCCVYMYEVVPGIVACSSFFPSSPLIPPMPIMSTAHRCFSNSIRPLHVVKAGPVRRVGDREQGPQGGHGWLPIRRHARCPAAGWRPVDCGSSGMAGLAVVGGRRRVANHGANRDVHRPLINPAFMHLCDALTFLTLGCHLLHR